MEKELFSWEDWDEAELDLTEADIAAIIFYNVQLKIDLSEDCPKGTKFESAVLDYTTGKLILERKDATFIFLLGLRVIGPAA